MARGSGSSRPHRGTTEAPAAGTGPSRPRPPAAVSRAPWVAEAQVAAQLGISLLQIQSLLEARSPVTAPLALKLARVFQTTPQVWLNLQQAYDLYHARARDGDIHDHPPGHSARPAPHRPHHL